MAAHSTISPGSPWYTLFSRGARDWLRHNQKIRASVQQQLPDLVASADLITGPEQRTVHLPVRVLEHARFRLADNPTESFRCAGQGRHVDQQFRRFLIRKRQGIAKDEAAFHPSVSNNETP